MHPEREPERSCLAVLCTREGVIEQILRDDLAVAAAGAKLSDIVDRGSSRKAENFIAYLRGRECTAGWQLNVPFGAGARPFAFAGAAGQGALLILAAASDEQLRALFDEVADSSLAASQALRALLHEPRAGISTSMSRDNQLYEELSRLNNELINRERELARKTAALERLSAEKARLVAIAAHDLRNPLTVIASYADLLRIEGAVQGEHLLDLEEISRSARFMTELVEEMLDSSRVESGHVELDLQEIDLVNAARHAARINQMRADRKQIGITFDPRVEHASIRADAVKLRQIINNLVVNAIKFSPPRSTVTIRVESISGMPVLEVVDEGVGIPNEKLLTIFEPFKTLGASGTAGEKSTGLGLAIVKQLVALHGARVEVESEVGRGSVFRVIFGSRGDAETRRETDR
jgi:two-component system OmpR family sensor kinase